MCPQRLFVPMLHAAPSTWLRPSLGVSPFKAAYSSLRRLEHYRAPRRRVLPFRASVSRNWQRQQRPDSQRLDATQSSAKAGDATSAADSLSSVLHDTNPAENNLLAPVNIPEDKNAVLKEKHPAASILANSGLVVQRQLEMMNVLM